MNNIHEYFCHGCEHMWESKINPRMVECPICRAIGKSIEQIDDDEEE